jgi:hypothetical protein
VSDAESAIRSYGREDIALTTPLTIDRLSNNCPLAFDLPSGKRRCPGVREMERDKGHMRMMELCTNDNVLHNY